MDAIIRSGGSDLSLAQSNAGVSSLARALLELPILPVAGLMDREVEIEAG
jgi:hypothetical protein